MWDNEGKRWHMSTSNAMNTAREEIFKRDMLTCIECKTPGPIKLAVHTHSEKVECLENPILEHFITLCAFCWRRLYVKDGEAEMTEVPPVIVTRQVISQRNRLFRKSIYVRMQCQECKQPLEAECLSLLKWAVFPRCCSMKTAMRKITTGKPIRENLEPLKRNFNRCLRNGMSFSPHILYLMPNKGAREKNG